jgi:hypothetical protein
MEPLANVTDAINRRMSSLDITLLPFVLLDDVPSLYNTTLDDGDMDTDNTGVDGDAGATSVVITTEAIDERPSADETVNVNWYTDSGVKYDDDTVRIDDVNDDAGPSEHELDDDDDDDAPLDTAIEHDHWYVNDDEPLDDVLSGSNDCDPSITNATDGDTNRLPPAIVATNDDGMTLTVYIDVTELLEPDEDDAAVTLKV